MGIDLALNIVMRQIIIGNYIGLVKQKNLHVQMVLFLMVLIVIQGYIFLQVILDLYGRTTTDFTQNETVQYQDLIIVALEDISLMEQIVISLDSIFLKAGNLLFGIMPFI
jgi:hypothetical protein